MHIIRRPDTGGCVDRPSELGGYVATARRATKQKPCKRRKGEHYAVRHMAAGRERRAQCIGGLSLHLPSTTS